MGSHASLYCHHNVLMADKHDKVPAGVQAETNPGVPVLLNVYDLNEDWEDANSALEGVGLGAFHAAVEVYGREWSYGSKGITSNSPRCHEVHVYRQSISMGRTAKSAGKVLWLIEQKLVPVWTDSDYSMFKHNCCSFANALCKELVGRRIPGWVDRLPLIGSGVATGMNNIVDLPHAVTGIQALHLRPFSLESVFSAESTRDGEDNQDLESNCSMVSSRVEQVSVFASVSSVSASGGA